MNRLGWHICSSKRELSYGDGRKVRVGQRLEFKKPHYASKPLLCVRGMHASPTPYDAKRAWNQVYSKSGDLGSDQGWICRVLVEGTNYTTRNKNDEVNPAKFVGTHRTVLGMIPLTEYYAVVYDPRFYGKPELLQRELLEKMRKRNRKNKNKTEVR